MQIQNLLMFEVWYFPSVGHNPSTDVLDYHNPDTDVLGYWEVTNSQGEQCKAEKAGTQRSKDTP